VLRHESKPIQAALVEFMLDRRRATFEDVVYTVHGNKKASDAAIKANCLRVNRAAAILAVPVRFRLRSGYVYKDPLEAGAE
jgi:hypothetical protein